MLALGTNDVMWGALQTGRVAATILSPPGTLFARKAGMNFMVDLTDLKLEYQGSTIATRRSLVQKIRRCHSGNCERSSKAFICLRPARKILCAFSVSSSAPVIASAGRIVGICREDAGQALCRWKAPFRQCSIIWRKGNPSLPSIDLPISSMRASSARSTKAAISTNSTALMESKDASSGLM